MTVEQIVNAIIEREGGYVNNPADSGGATCWGITERVARACGYKGDMRDLPRETAFSLYKAQYWQGPRFDEVAKISPLLAEKLCDTGVNMGPSVAVKFLQEWLNGFNCAQKLYPDVVVDGQIGPRTVSALTQFLQHRGKNGVTALLRGLNASQGVYYLTLSQRREKDENFLIGWMLQRTSFE